MKNSPAFQYLVSQINASGSQKQQGYRPNILNKISDWERDDAEKLIWEGFLVKQDVDLAVYLPELKNYDGIVTLKSKLKDCNIPSDKSVIIAEVLYKELKDKKYLEVLKQNYYLSRDKTAITSRLISLAENDEIKTFLEQIYLTNEESKIRDIAIEGILWKAGYISKIHDVMEFFNKRELFQKFDKNDAIEREEMLEKLKNGEI